MHDLKNMTKLGKLGGLAGEGTWEAFGDFSAKAFAEGALSVKTKELIALAVALTTQCGYCIESHRKKAIAAGATEEEMAEMVFVTMAMRAGGALTHGTHLID